MNLILSANVISSPLGPKRPITAVMAESRQGWLDIRARVAECRPRHVLGDTDPASLDARYEVGPTGSLRDVGR